jgi:hypothetical protein
MTNVPLYLTATDGSNVNQFPLNNMGHYFCGPFATSATPRDTSGQHDNNFYQDLIFLIEIACRKQNEFLVPRYHLTPVCSFDSPTIFPHKKTGLFEG